MDLKRIVIEQDAQQQIEILKDAFPAPKTLAVDLTTNPHLRQNQNGFHYYGIDELLRILPTDSPRRSYFKIPHSERSVNHWGQRKLLLSEIEFLTLYGKPNHIVIYAGAAPGTHIPFLSTLFPHLQFFLYDPAQFKIEPTEQIKIHQQFFLSETISELKKLEPPRTFLLISDVRTADPKVMSVEEVEEAIVQDMQLQMDWVKELSPIASMLKFRLPWGDGISEYLKGDIYLPIWGPQTTTESRLIVTDIETISYDNCTYSDQMFYFNTVTRVQYYDHDITGVEGLDHCYDCAAEVIVLKNYLLSYKHNVENCHHCQHKKKETCNGLRGDITQLIADISNQCSNSGRTLASQPNFHARNSWYHGRRYDVKNQMFQDLGHVKARHTKSIIPVKPRSITAVAVSHQKRRVDDQDETPPEKKIKQ